jgi:hypothetical protein
VKGSLAAVVVALLAGVLSAPALAESGVSIDVYHYSTQPGRTEALDLYVDVTAAQPATSSATVYVPSGYALDTSKPAGTELGRVTLRFYAGKTLVSGVGDLIAADRSLHVADLCSPGLHAAVWIIQAYVAGHDIEVPVYVDGTGSDLAGVASYTLHACFSEPGANSGMRLTELAVGLNKGLLKSPIAKGEYVWRALVTPYGADEVPLTSGTSEVQTLVVLPQVLTLAARFDAKRRVVTLSGSLTAGGRARSDTIIRFWAATDAKFSHSASFGFTRTDARGRFTFTKALKQTAWFDAYVRSYLYEGCHPALGAAPCVLETISPPPDAYRKVVVRR